MMLNSLVTTVATPLKKLGLVLPSIWWLNPLTSTKVPFCSVKLVVMPLGYISSTVGVKTAFGVCTSPFEREEILRDERTSRSCGRVRG